METNLNTSTKLYKVILSVALKAHFQVWDNFWQLKAF